MTEYLSEAIVLDKSANGDLNLRVSLFTKKFGKLVAKARSARRILSKLSPHLEPGNVVQARLIEKNGLQVVDALKQSRLETNPSNLYFLNQILAEQEPDIRLWRALVSGASGSFDWAQILEILGWDPREAACALCMLSSPAAFNISKQELLCGGCASKFAQGSLLYI